VQPFDATFEQHYEGGQPAARGEIHIANPPPPPPLTLGLVVATDSTANTVNGDAVLHGTVKCSKPATVTITGDLVQVHHGLLARHLTGTVRPVWAPERRTRYLCTSDASACKQIANRGMRAMVIKWHAA
jgi:hypothetical protein